MHKLVPGSLLAVVFLAQVASAQDSWIARTSSPTNAVYHSFVQANGYLWRYGFGTPGPCVRYDPVADTWSTMASMPVSNRSFAAAAYNGSLYAFGNGAFGSTACYAYAIGTNTWRTLTATLANATNVPVAVTHGSRIYICGGVYNQGTAYTDDVNIFDPATETITPGPPLPVPLALGIMGSVGTRIYYIGGQRQGTWPGNISSAVYELDIRTATWTQKASMPAPIAGGAGFTLQSRINMVGGLSNGGTSNYQATNYEYYPGSDTWATRAPLPNGVRAMAAATSFGTKAYFLGGTSGGGVMFASLLEYTPIDFGQPPATPTGLFMRAAGSKTNLAEGAVINATTMEFGATATDPDPGDIVTFDVEAIPAGGPTVTGSGSSIVQLTGFAETSYSWRCRSRDLLGNVSAWQFFGTGAIDFTLDWTPPGPVVGTSPIDVVLQAPSATGMIVDFTWDPVVDAATYDLEVAGSIYSSTSQVHLPPGFHAWRVRGVDAVGNPGVFSPIYQFQVEWHEDPPGGDGRCGQSAAGGPISLPAIGFLLLLIFTIR